MVDGNASIGATTVAATVTVASNTPVDITVTNKTTAALTNPPNSSEGTFGLTFSLNQTFTVHLISLTQAQA